MKWKMIDCSLQEREFIQEIQKYIPLKEENDGIRIKVEQMDVNGYELIFQEDIVVLRYQGIPSFLRALLYLDSAEEKTNVYAKRHFRDFGIMFDLSRNAVLRVQTLKEMIRIAALLGYSFLGLYLEDTYKIDEEPYFGYMRGALTEGEIKEVDQYAQKFGIEIRPFIQTLAHMNQIVRYQEYEKIIDTDDILLIDDERTKLLLEHQLKSIAQKFTSRNINIGMDEAYMVGLGKYLELHGYHEKTELMKRHLSMLRSLLKKYGFKAQMWSDMFFKALASGGYTTDEKIDLEQLEVPFDISLGYWDYYSQDETHYEEMIKKHLKISHNVSFAGGAWKWTGFAPHNRYSIKNSEAALQACINNKIQSVTITCWGDDGAECSVFAVLPTLFQNAKMAYSDSMSDKAFEIITGYPFETFLQLDDLNPISYTGKTHNNASKFLLYNDPLIGIFDSLIKEDLSSYYEKQASLYEKLITSDSRFSYLFKTNFALCNVLKHKVRLGKDIEKYYKAGEKQKLLRSATEEITLLQKELDAFYELFMQQWYLENKSFGWEVQAIRIGGLKQRLCDTKKLLLLYFEGKIASIDELEEKRMPYHYTDEKELESLNYNLWMNIVSPSKI